MRLTDERRKRLFRKLFRAMLRTSADAYAFKLARQYYARDREDDSDLAHRIAALNKLGNISTHYSYFRLDGNGLLHLEAQLARLMQQLERCLTLNGANEGPVLDAGDSDGLVMSAMSLLDQGVSLNMLDVCVRSCRARGLPAVRADIESLPFGDRTFDAVFCFEAVEHLENPIHGLRELARVARRRLFLTIPFVETTRIYEDNYTRNLPEPNPEPEHHVFEFSPDDMKKVISHADLDLVRFEKLDIFGPIRSPWHRFMLRTFYEPCFFPAFQFYELAPRRRS